jgi:Predicted metal-dependent hydrolase of the TIM-barrel fold
VGRKRPSWWYEAAAFITLMRPRVWIELSGLPPKSLPRYYSKFDLPRLAQRFIFGTDWPGTPGIAKNAAAVAALGFDRPTLERIFWRNAFDVYALGRLTGHPRRGGSGRRGGTSARSRPAAPRHPPARRHRACG